VSVVIMDEAIRTLEARLLERGPCLIAFSGGVDSSVLAALARRALGDQALCVTIDSSLVKRTAIEMAVAIALSLGIRHEVVPIPILADREFTANPENRCYLCKKAQIGVLKRIAAAHGIACIADGLNASDEGEYRPGIHACAEEGVWHPLAEAGLVKEDVRSIARSLGLPNADMPADSCLATRIPYGETITAARLAQVEAAEEALSRRGFAGSRVRAHGDLARIEVRIPCLPKVLAEREAISADLRAIGFRHIALDLRGYRTGSMDE
jgi:uncharacterized protein